LTYRGFIAGNAVVNGVRLVGCSNTNININGYGVVSTAWVEFLTTACTNITVTGYMFTSGITNYTRDVVDTVTGSTWWASFTDGSAGAFISGGSAAALAPDDVGAVATNVSTLLVGSTFWIKKTMVSSAILSASAVDLTGVSSGGELAVKSVILKTDGTGLATGTNVQIKSNNTSGLANILVETVANLGANKTIYLGNASVTGIPTVLESGKKFQIQSTVAACTGSGTVDVYFQLERLSSGATIAAA